MAYGTLLSDVVQSSTANTPPQFNDGNGTQVGTLCRAWVNFNGTGTVAINASFNVSSITDNGTGSYTVNLTNAMPDANYSTVSTAKNSAGTGRVCQIQSITTTTALIYTFASGSGALNDADSVYVAIFR